MPAASVIDAHQHFWDPRRAGYPWMTGAKAGLRRPFGPDDLRPALRTCGVESTILVQTRSSYEESKEFLALAAASGFVAGVVAWVDLTDPAAGERIAELRQHPGGDCLAGIRHQVEDEPDPDWLRRPDVQRGLRAVGDAGLVYDLLVTSRELPAALAVARLNPGVRFVIDHIAQPPIEAGEIEPWATLMAPFAELENVCCKLSGMVTMADHRHWTPADLSPYAERVLEWFGPGRLLFGSDWPVCLLAADYPGVLRAAEQVLARISPNERAQIFRGTAAGLYRLGEKCQ